MSAFEIDLKDLQRTAVERELRPDAATLQTLFSRIGEDYELVNADDFKASVRAQLSDSTVHVSGRAYAEFSFRCGRCVAEQPLVIDTEIDFVLMSEAEWSRAYAGYEEIALNAEDLDVSFYTDDLIDLGALIREAFILELPPHPRCPEALREECDARFKERVGAETLAKMEDDKLDPRFAALKNLRITDDGKIEKVPGEQDKD